MRWKDLHRSEQGLARPVWDAVVRLRKAGHRVYCARRASGGQETHHEFYGQIVPTSWLLDMAHAERLAGGAHG